VESDDDITPLEVIRPEPKPPMEGPETFRDHILHKLADGQREQNRLISRLIELQRDKFDDREMHRRHLLRLEECFARVEDLLTNLLHYFEPAKGNGHG
jgi:hypothetical protein